MREILATMQAQTVTVQIQRNGSMCFIPVPFDPQAVFGRWRAPVRVTLNGYTYRTTIASMGEVCGVPLRRSNREAAGLEGRETLVMKFELDADPRVVTLPLDLAELLRQDARLIGAWHDLSFTDQREHAKSIEGAKRPETRARRMAKAVEAISLSADKSSRR